MRNLTGLLCLVLIHLLLISCGIGSSREISLIPVKNGDDYQYVDKEGKIIINPQFSQATAFRDGLALVRGSGKNPKWGFINEEGSYVIPASFKDATVFSENLAWVVTENQAPTAIDENGEVKFTLQDAETVVVFKEGLAAFSIQSKESSDDLNSAADSIAISNGIDPLNILWGFVNTEGNVVIRPQFTATRNFSGGLCAVLDEEGKWGYIDKEGKIVIPHQFDDAGNFVDGMAVVEFDGKSGSIDEDGKYIINPQFENMIVDGDIYLIEQNDKWGWADRDGKIIINPQFDETLLFLGNELAPVKMGDDVGYVDKEGKIKINPQFSGGLPFVDNWAIVKSGKKYGIIDSDGKYIVNPLFDDVSNDLVTYIIDGSSSYESVESDYFNIAPILSRIDLESPEGLTLNSTIRDAVAKLNLSEQAFNQYSETHTLLNNVSITSDANMSFSVQAISHQEIVVGWYWERVFNPSAPITGLNYTINLYNKGYYKADQVMSAIEKEIKGLKKDEVESANGEWTVYANSTKKIYLNTRENQVNIWIMKAN